MLRPGGARYEGPGIGCAIVVVISESRQAESGVLPRSWPEVAMPMVFSLAILTLLATIMLWAYVCGPLDLFRSGAWVGVAGLSVGLARHNRRRPDGPARRRE